MAALPNCLGSAAATLAAGKSSGGSMGSAARRAGKGAILKVTKFSGIGIWPTPEPFLFCAYHDDYFPAGNNKMQAPRRGNGADFDYSAPYRMYHGDRVPGFPQHPHRGFETMTAVLKGTIDHTDSMGAAGRYSDGDLQWMTAGAGIVHGEMFPLLHDDKTNQLELFQIWLNLPKKDKMVAPYFTMHWRENIPKFVSEDERVKVIVWAGDVGGKKGLEPPPNSWAARADADVAVWHITISPGGRFTLPASNIAGTAAVRRLYFYFNSGGKGGGAKSGSSGSGSGKSVPAELRISGMAEALSEPTYVDVAAEADDIELHNPAAEGGATATVLLLQGRPIGEPIAQHGPFVMNTQQEIQQCFSDYQRTKFGGWPWSEDAVVFPREKGRFAKSSAQAKEELPPSGKK